MAQETDPRYPVAWAYAIVKNLSSGNPCTYWDEFKAGIPLGTSEQREWEITPGVACTIAVQLEQQESRALPVPRWASGGMRVSEEIRLKPNR